MRSPLGGSGRWLARVLACCVAGVVGLLVWVGVSGVFGGSGARSVAVADVPAASPVPGLSLTSLDVPGVQPLDGDQQASDVQQARHSSSAAYLGRIRSRTEFEHLKAPQAAQVAREAFPTLIEKHDGGAPSLPPGQRVVRYTAPNVAQLALPGGKHAVIESMAPMATPTTAGHFTPIDLALTDAGSSYIPASSDVPVQIPKQLSDGVRTPEDGVSLTPVEASGDPLAGAEGSVDGASVIYANTETDTDTVAKPTGRGFEVSSILRSIDSPQRLYYRVGLPSSASLVQRRSRGPVEIVSDGVPIAMVMPPGAVDASGDPVTLTMQVKGTVLELEVKNNSSEYQYPIEVDPEVTTEDRSLTGAVFPIEPYKGGTNWLPFETFPAFHYEKNYSCGSEWYWCDQSWYIEPRSSYSGSEYAGIQYETQGVSKLYEFESWLEGENEPSETLTQVEIDTHGGIGTYTAPLSKGPYYKNEPALICAQSGRCEPSEGTEGGLARVMDYTSKSEPIYGFWTQIWDARVYIAQEQGPEASSTTACPECGFNTSSATITDEAGTRSNVLYGGGSWLGPNAGAFEATAKDPGIGVSFAAFSGGGMSEERFIQEKEGDCKGIQCTEKYSGHVTYLPTMANGDDSIEFFAEDAAGLYGYTTKTIKVDAEKPYNLGFTGMSENGAEISAAPHKLTIHATDGKKPTPSSGVKSIEVSIDGGKATAVSGSSCPEGECTASGSYTLYAEGLAEGVNSLIVTATDNAGNVTSKSFYFDVRHASPVSVGPGTVDPTSGQFILSAQDVSLGGSSGVSRTYQSRNLTAGVGGPLGPQWAMSVGGGEHLTVLSNGSVVLAAAGGGQTTFLLNEKGEFESPKGDENLKIGYESKEHKYLLKNSTSGTETVFEQPAGTESTSPTYSSQFGSEGALLMNHPAGVAIDSSGNAWVADYLNDRILKLSPTGALLGEYGSYGHLEGQYNQPREITINPTNKDVYITDEDNSRIVELNEKGEFLRTFGWDVSNGKEETEVCTSDCQAGITGNGGGQLKEPKGLAVDASGNVWVADYGNNRIQEFNSEGKFLQTFGKEGSGEGQFKEPSGIVVDGGNLYVAEAGNNRVQELTTAGKYVAQFGKAGSGNGEFDEPRGITADPRTGNLYVSDTSNNRVQEFTSAGKWIAKFGANGSGSGQFSGPRGMAVNASGDIYVADYGNNRVEEWARSTWVSTTGKGPTSSALTTYSYKAVTSGGETVIEPAEELGPKPEGAVCSAEPEKSSKTEKEKEVGCRELTFVYGTKTGAGEKESEWGEYEGRLMEVKFTAYNPSSKEMQTTTVAKYAYDKLGRLRAEWDPRVEKTTTCGGSCSALKTIYGYDAEGHVTALTPPGQESWAFTYGTIAGDPNMGRLIKLTRAAASAKLWAGAIPEALERPKLSGTAAVGAKMGVSTGLWLGEPIVYAYSWEDCNSSGGECVPILGATNANYTPVGSDLGHTLIAKVTATNGSGSISKATVASTPVSGDMQLIDSGNSLSAVSCISGSDCVTTDSKGRALYATNVSSMANGTWNLWNGPTASPSEAVDCLSTSSCLMAAGSDEGNGGNMYYATSLGGVWKEVFSPTYGVDAISCPSSSFCVEGQDGEGYFRYSTNPSSSWTLEQQGSASMKGVSCFLSSFCAIVDSVGRVHVATTTSQVESSSWKETDIDSTTALNGIACTSTTSCVAIDGAGNVLNLTIETSGAAAVSKHDIDGTTSLTAVTCTTASVCVTVDSQGNIFVSTNNGSTWEKLFSLGDKLTSVSCSSSSLCVAADTTGSVIAFNPGAVLSEAPAQSPQPGWTLEYHLPVAGTGRPNLPNMTKEEVEKWGQKDRNESEDNDPVEGMAIFPPGEPQSWPASSYKRATIDYLNNKGLAVNMATPSGGISTTEYDSLNEPVRTLSPDDRARALAEGCKSVEKNECESAEASEKLDTKTEYNPEGTDVWKVTGPEHTIKLSRGPEEAHEPEEVQARSVTHYYYDKGSKEVEEKTHEVYNLVTTTVEGALLTSNGKEEENRETVTSYGGQEDLGWKLRKPTSVTKEPGGLNLTSTSVYEENANGESTGQVVEALSPEGSSGGPAVAHVFASQFGPYGSGSGQLSYPSGDALDSHGDLWVADHGNSRVEEFSPTGQFVASYGTKGAGAGQFTNIGGIAINQVSGNVYVVDAGNERIDELSSEGKFVEAFGFGVNNGEEKLETCTSSCRAGTAGSGSGQFNGPEGIAIDASGNIWVVDQGNNRLEEFSPEAKFTAAYGTKGSGHGQFKEPDAVAFSAGNLYVTDPGNGRVQELSPTGAFIMQFGSYGSGNGQFSYPVGIAADPDTGALYVGDPGNGRVEEFTQHGNYVAQFGTKGSGEGQFKESEGIVVNAAGDVYVADTGNSRVEEWDPVPPTPTYTSQFGNTGSESEKLKEPAMDAVDSHGDVWVANWGKGTIEEFSSSGAFMHSYGSYGTGSGQFRNPIGIAVNQSTGNVYVGDYGNNRIDELNEKGEFVAGFGYGVGNHEEKFETCTTSCVGGNPGSGVGQFSSLEGVAVDPKGDVWAADSGNNRVEEFSSSNAFMVALGFGVTNGEEKLEVCTSSCRAGIAGSGNGQFKDESDLTFSGANMYVADTHNERIEEFNEKGEFVSKFGSGGHGDGEFWEPSALGVDACGNIYVADYGNYRIQEFTPSGMYLTQFGSKGTGNGQFSSLEAVTVGSSGAVYAVDGAGRLEQWTPAPRPGNEGAHDAKTIYYSAKAESPVTACRNHPEWTNLVCQIEPAAQPGVGGAPELPITRTTYNVWDEPEIVEEKFGSTTRTKKEMFDGDGREESSEVSSSPATDKALSKVSDKYSEKTGALVEQSTTNEGKTKGIISVYNTLGQIEKYTDASGKSTKYVYEAGGERSLDEVSYEIGKEPFSQIYSYNSITGFMESEYDSGLKKYFTASYNVEGKILTETYPDGLTAHYTYSPVGTATGIKYEKSSYCASKCPETWFEDSTVPSIHGEMLEQTSTLAGESYMYDSVGRLLEAQETPTGKDCIAHLYAYDEESNRTSETTRESSTKTCSTEGGTTESHSYDSANALIDTGVSYEAFGNITKLPAPDAGKYALDSSYYVDGQVSAQEQQETEGEVKTLGYVYDPEGRTEETETILKEGGKETHEQVATSNYSGPGQALMWTGQEENKKWSRNVPGIDGALDAVQTSAGTSMLQLHDLHGNVVATVGLSETETKLSTTYNSTEFGVPNENKPVPKYAWLGVRGATSELPSSGSITQGGMSYVPEIAMDLQTAPVVPPGAMPNGPNGGTPYTAAISAASIASAQAEATKYTEEMEAARQRLREKEAAEALRKCQEEGGCGAGGGAAGGGSAASGELTQEEWREYYERYLASLGTKAIAASGGILGFEDEIGKAVNAVESATDELGGFVERWGSDWYGWQTEAYQALGVEIGVELRRSFEKFTEPFGEAELILDCVQSGNELAVEVSEGDPFGGVGDPLEEANVTAAGLMGCESAFWPYNKNP